MKKHFPLLSMVPFAQGFWTELNTAIRLANKIGKTFTIVWLVEFSSVEIKNIFDRMQNASKREITDALILQSQNVK